MCVPTPPHAAIANRGGGTITGRAVCWTVASIAAGQTATKTVTVRIDGTWTGGTLATTATATVGTNSATTAGRTNLRVRVLGAVRAPVAPPVTG